MVNGDRVGGLMVEVSWWSLRETDYSMSCALWGFWDLEERIDRFDESVEFTPEKISWSVMALV